jgi:site-specific DNA-methyltransferase (adenine-specific)
MIKMEDSQVFDYQDVIANIVEQLPDMVCEADVVEYIKTNNISLNGDGKGVQAVIDFFQNGLYVNGKTVEGKVSFETEDGRVKIYNQDVLTFLKSLPDSSVDLIITDPAYSGMNQKLKLGKGKIIGTYKDKGDGAKWFDEFHDTEENYNAFLAECHRVLKPNRHIFIMFDSYSLLSLAPMLRETFEVKNILVWDKQHIGLGHYFRRRHEFIVFASKGKRHLTAKNIPDVWRIKRVTNFKYPTQKPTEVFEMMIASSAEKDFVVCDPFLGSGSSAIASLKRGCKFIGCDIASSSIETSTNRVKWYLENGTDNLQLQSLVEDKDIKNILTNG